MPFTSLSYWDQFYQERQLPTFPSQFSIFALNEFHPNCVVDIGCGNGRDTFFFASYGLTTIGVDASASAIRACRSSAEHLGATEMQFIESSIADDSLSERISALVSQKCSNLLIYSRFFVHAINEEEEGSLIELARKLLLAHNGSFVCEFRTIKDELLPKNTATHYRRFIDPSQFISNAEDAGLRCSYFVEGTGMAKSGVDDAHVARVVLTISEAGS
jgi:SAM-dependent methyltransferase